MTRSKLLKMIAWEHRSYTDKKIRLLKNDGRHVPDKKDIEIAEEILRIHAKLQKALIADGEWKWINEHKKRNYIKALQKGDPRVLALILANVFQEDASYGFYTY